MFSAAPLSVVPNRGKKVKATGVTKNKSGRPQGRKRGVKVYDGQRVPTGTTLCTQMRLGVLPGWNVSFKGVNDLRADCHGRVLITTEKIAPKWEAAGAEGRRLDGAFPAHLRDRNIFRLHMHVVPDLQHRYFKLVEQV